MEIAHGGMARGFGGERSLSFRTRLVEPGDPESERDNPGTPRDVPGLPSIGSIGCG
jgi:hypothetical protein